MDITGRDSHYSPVVNHVLPCWYMLVISAPDPGVRTYASSVQRWLLTSDRIDIHMHTSIDPIRACYLLSAARALPPLLCYAPARVVHVERARK